MAITIRPMRPDEGRIFLEVHHAAIRGLAASHYSEEVIDAWAPPITEAVLKRFDGNPGDELRLLAELDGEIVGLGVIVPLNEELRACYVAPHAARKGVGTALVREIERIARERGVRQLHLEASLNAETFYVACGYEPGERGEHLLRGMVPMASVRMRKTL